MSEARGRGGAEWVTFSISTAIVGVVVALLAVQALSTDEPAAPVAEVDPSAASAVGQVFHVPVDVVNDGDRAAVNVQVLAELTVPDGVESSDQTVDFLGAGETERLVFVFTTDPADGELSVMVGGFTEP